MARPRRLTIRMVLLVYEKICEDPSVTAGQRNWLLKKLLDIMKKEKKEAGR